MGLSSSTTIATVMSQIWRSLRPSVLSSDRSRLVYALIPCGAFHMDEVRCALPDNSRAQLVRSFRFADLLAPYFAPANTGLIRNAYTILLRGAPPSPFPARARGTQGEPDAIVVYRGSWRKLWTSDGYRIPNLSLYTTQGSKPGRCHPTIRLLEDGSARLFFGGV